MSKRKRLKIAPKNCLSCGKQLEKYQRLRGDRCNGACCLLGFMLGNEG